MQDRYCVVALGDNIRCSHSDKNKPESTTYLHSTRTHPALRQGDASEVPQFLHRRGGTSPRCCTAILSQMSRWAKCAYLKVCGKAGLQCFHCHIMCSKFVRLCVVPFDETEATSRKWAGMEDLTRDSGLKMKEFFYTQNPPFFSLFFLFFLYSFASKFGVSPTLVHIMIQQDYSACYLQRNPK